MSLTEIKNAVRELSPKELAELAAFISKQDNAAWNKEMEEDAAAGKLDKAASALHEKAESLPGGEKVSSLAHATAEKLSSTADYVREHDVKRMMADVETLVKNNPGPSLLAAVAVGFLVARAFSSND